MDGFMIKKHERALSYTDVIIDRTTIFVSLQAGSSFPFNKDF